MLQGLHAAWQLAAREWTLIIDQATYLLFGRPTLEPITQLATRHANKDAFRLALSLPFLAIAPLSASPPANDDVPGAMRAGLAFSAGRAL